MRRSDASNPTDGSLSNKALQTDELVGRAPRSLWRSQLNAGTLDGQAGEPCRALTQRAWSV
jgi:hypothetical protein